MNRAMVSFQYIDLYNTVIAKVSAFSLKLSLDSRDIFACLVNWLALEFFTYLVPFFFHTKEYLLEEVIV